MLALPPITDDVLCHCFRYLIDNPIDNYTISDDFFNEIAGLTNFNINAPDDSYNCSNGTWTATHNVEFCVLNSTSSSGGAHSVRLDRFPKIGQIH